MLFRKKKEETINYDPTQQEPVIRCSICTGEQTAGLRDLDTGKFHEIMLIHEESDLISFQKMVGTEEIRKIY
ncbi:MAG: aspartate dehydrogenase [Eubacterium sp.]|nr:aspartate dehydrogenase [Eubacterium sp.]